MRPSNPVLMNAVSNTGTKVSVAIDSRFMTTATLQATFTDATAGGTLTLQGSNDPFEELPGGEAPQNWVLIPNATWTIASGADTLTQPITICYRWVRASWVSSAGAGTFNVNGFFIGFN